jgi:hypothetical protein
MKTNYTKCGMVNLYTVQTELMDDGQIHAGRTPVPVVPEKPKTKN